MLIDNTEGIEGIVDDVNEDAKEENAEILAMKSQMEAMQQQMKQSSVIQDEKTKAVMENFSKAVGFIEGSGIGKYDPDTGKIIKIEQAPAGPDPMEELQKTIKDTEKDLVRQFKDGDITQAEYVELLQDTVVPLKDKYRDMEFDNKFNDLKKEFANNNAQKEKETTPGVNADVQEKAREYESLAEEYPDIANKDSQLFKKMDEIYGKNQHIYSNANFDGGKGDPRQYKDLIDRAALELRVEGIDVKKQQSAIRNQFATPGSQGYQEPETSNAGMSKQEVGMMVSQGFNNKSILNEVNAYVSNWDKSGGTMVMKD